MQRWMIRPRGTQWELRREMSAMPQAVFEHQEDAIFAGRMEAIAVAGELFVQGRDGRVQVNWTQRTEIGLTPA